MVGTPPPPAPAPRRALAPRRAPGETLRGGPHAQEPKAGATIGGPILTGGDNDSRARGNDHSWIGRTPKWVFQRPNKYSTLIPAATVTNHREPPTSLSPWFRGGGGGGVASLTLPWCHKFYIESSSVCPYFALMRTNSGRRGGVRGTCLSIGCGKNEKFEI